MSDCTVSINAAVLCCLSILLLRFLTSLIPPNLPHLVNSMEQKKVLSTAYVFILTLNLKGEEKHNVLSTACNTMA